MFEAGIEFVAILDETQRSGQKGSLELVVELRLGHRGVQMPFLNVARQREQFRSQES